MSDRGSHPSSLLERFCARGDPQLAPGALVVGAHPDDEVIGAGGRFPWIPRLFLVQVTDGAPADMSDARAAGFPTREDYARQRREELRGALTLAGISPERSLAVGIMDQNASFHLTELARRLMGTIQDIKPDVVVTHPFNGGHPDHDAASFAVHAAVAELGRNHLPDLPFLIEYPSYFGENGVFTPLEFIPRDGYPPRTVPLSAEERTLKAGMIQCFRTQVHLLKAYPLDKELFRQAPPYRFTEPPHAGKLYYENFNWSMTGEWWRRLVREALQALRLEEPL